MGGQQQQQQGAAASASTSTEPPEIEIAEQPLSADEVDLVRKYRDINKFLRGSAFFVREPDERTHKDLARYSDQSVSPRPLFLPPSCAAPATATQLAFPALRCLRLVVVLARPPCRGCPLLLSVA
jgi:hypothetical protein